MPYTVHIRHAERGPASHALELSDEAVDALRALVIAQPAPEETKAFWEFAHHLLAAQEEIEIMELSDRVLKSIRAAVAEGMEAVAKASNGRVEIQENEDGSVLFRIVGPSPMQVRVDRVNLAKFVTEAESGKIEPLAIARFLAQTATYDPPEEGKDEAPDHSPPSGTSDESK